MAHELEQKNAELRSLLTALQKERDEFKALCAKMLPVFEAARPLVLNLERLREAAKGT